MLSDIIGSLGLKVYQQAHQKDKVNECIQKRYEQSLPATVLSPRARLCLSWANTIMAGKSRVLLDHTSHES